MTGRHGAIDVNHDVFRDLRATMAEVRPDSWLVGEHLHDATADLAGDGWHGVMACWWFTRAGVELAGPAVGAADRRSRSAPSRSAVTTSQRRCAP